jgi:hypothetical protein
MRDSRPNYPLRHVTGDLRVAGALDRNLQRSTSSLVEEARRDPPRLFIDVLRHSGTAKSMGSRRTNTSYNFPYSTARRACPAEASCKQCSTPKCDNRHNHRGKLILTAASRVTFSKASPLVRFMAPPPLLRHLEVPSSECALRRRAGLKSATNPAPIAANAASLPQEAARQCRAPSPWDRETFSKARFNLGAVPRRADQQIIVSSDSTATPSGDGRR